MAQKNCPECGTDFQMPRKDSTYCSRTCYLTQRYRSLQRGASKYAKRQCSMAAKSPTVADIAWAAGFIEGEGTFTPQIVSGRKYARVLAYQNNPEPLERLRAMFGGVIRRFERTHGTETAGTWCVNGARARGVMFTLFSFLSAKRRQQIRMALEGGY